MGLIDFSEINELNELKKHIMTLELTNENIEYLKNILIECDREALACADKINKIWQENPLLSSVNPLFIQSVKLQTIQKSYEGLRNFVTDYLYKNLSSKEFFELCAEVDGSYEELTSQYVNDDSNLTL